MWTAFLVFAIVCSLLGMAVNLHSAVTSEEATGCIAGGWGVGLGVIFICGYILLIVKMNSEG